MRNRRLIAGAAVALSGAPFIANVPSAAADSSVGDQWYAHIYAQENAAVAGQCLATLRADHTTSNGQQFLRVQVTTSGVEQEGPGGPGRLNTTTDENCAVRDMSITVKYEDPDGKQRASSAEVFAGNSVVGTFDGVPGAARVDTYIRFQMVCCESTRTTDTSAK